MCFFFVCVFFFSGEIRKILFYIRSYLEIPGGGRVWRRCHVSYVTWASNRNSLTVGQGLLSFDAGKGRGGMFLFCFFTFIPVPLSSLSLSFISSTISFLPFDTKCPTRVDVSLNPNTIKIWRYQQRGLSWRRFF